MTGDIEDIEVDITAEQKMLSAVSGSLFTSLLGTSLYLNIGFNILMILISNTSRCGPSSSAVTAHTILPNSYSKAGSNFTWVLQYTST